MPSERIGTLDDAAITSDAELTFKATPGETYAEAFARLLEEEYLAYLPREHYIWITSRDEAEERLETRLYAIHRLPDLDGDDSDLCWQLDKHLRATDPKHFLPATVNLLPGALVVTENRRRLALVEEFLSKHGLALREYGKKPTPPQEPPRSLE